MNSGWRDGPYASVNEESRKRVAAYVLPLRPTGSSLIRSTITRRHGPVLEDLRRALNDWRSCALRCDEGGLVVGVARVRQTNAGQGIGSGSAFGSLRAWPEASAKAVCSI